MTMEKESTIPGFFRRRELLEEKQPSKDTLRTLGSELAAQGLLDESLAFFVKAEDREGIERVLKESRQQGDTFTFEAALKALGETASQGDWREVGEGALKTGRLWFAYRAFEKADHQPGLEKVREIMKEKDITPPS
jgi:hypothetical protein